MLMAYDITNGGAGERMSVMQRYKDPLQDRNSYDRFWVKKIWASLRRSVRKRWDSGTGRAEPTDRTNKVWGFLLRTSEGVKNFFYD